MTTVRGAAQQMLMHFAVKNGFHSDSIEQIEWLEGYRYRVTFTATRLSTGLNFKDSFDFEVIPPEGQKEPTAAS
jgi:hypothetical protein